MSRTFSSGNFLSIASPLITVHPFTFACWFKSSSFSTIQMCIVVGSANVAEALYMYVDTTRHCLLNTRASAATATATSTTQATSGAWNHLAGTSSSASSRAAYMNGGGKGTNATSKSAGTMVATRIGESIDNTNPASADIAFPSIWTMALSDSDILSLSLGASPRLIHPEKLLSYNRMTGGNAPEPDWSYSAAWVVNGTPTQSVNPRIFYP